MVDQSAEGARADILAADEAQPVEPLLVGQPNASLIALAAHDAPAGQRSSIAQGRGGYNRELRNANR